jgi:hypothetical protein
VDPSRDDRVEITCPTPAKAVSRPVVCPLTVSVVAGVTVKYLVVDPAIGDSEASKITSPVLV